MTEGSTFDIAVHHRVTGAGGPSDFYCIDLDLVFGPPRDLRIRTVGYLDLDNVPWLEKLIDGALTSNEQNLKFEVDFLPLGAAFWLTLSNTPEPESVREKHGTSPWIDVRIDQSQYPNADAAGLSFIGSRTRVHRKSLIDFRDSVLGLSSNPNVPIVPPLPATEIKRRMADLARFQREGIPKWQP